MSPTGNLFLRALLFSLISNGIYSESQRAKVLSCDFEQDLGPCGLVNNNGAAQFQIRERKGADAQNVPARDVEQGKMFLFLPMYHFSPQPAVSTVTNINFVPPGKYCARFWLFMATDKNNEFYVERNSLENPETFQELGKFVGNNAPAWAKKNISFNALESSFKIRLRVVVIPGSYSHESMFALDDLELEQGNCDEDEAISVSCNFESSFESSVKLSCGYTVIAQEGLEWTRQSPDLYQSPEGQIPSADVTYHTGAGHFMVAILNATNSSSKNRATILQSPAMEKIAGESQCILFHYQILGTGGPNQIKLELNVKEFRTETNFNSELIWSSPQEQETMWITVKRQYFSRAPPQQMSLYTLQFIAAATNDTEPGYVAVDDVVMTNGVCRTAGDCDFDATLNNNTGYCEWQSVTDESTNMIWTNNMPGSKTRYLHFKGGRGSGNYVRSRALLFSEDLDYGKALCMSFYYHFDSFAAGMAEIRIHQVQAPTEENVVWSYKGQASSAESVAGDGWRLARVPLPKYICDPMPCATNEDFLVVIEGRIVREVSYQYNVSIKNVVFLENECEMVPASAEPLPEIQPPMEHASSVCNFDDDEFNPGCGFVTDESVDTKLQWHLRTGADLQLSHFFAPAFDHTTFEDIGKYLYFDAEYEKPHNDGDYARQISALYTRDQATDPRCIRFWYQIQTAAFLQVGFDVRYGGQLNVYADSNGTETLLWSSTQQSISYTWEWTLAVVKDIPASVAFKIILEAKILTAVGAFTTMAVDDFMVENSECKEIDCDFEEGMCSWQNYYDSYSFEPLADLSWEYGNMKLPVFNGTADSFENRGLFVYVPVLPSTPPNHQALLENLEQMPGKGMNCLTFEFLVTDPNAGIIAVWEKNHNPQTGQINHKIVWQSNDSELKAGTWQTGQIPVIGNVTGSASWSLLFEGLANPNNVTLSNKLHALALDNIRHRLISDALTCPTLPSDAGTETTPLIPATTPATATNMSTMVLFNCSFNKDWCGFMPQEIHTETNPGWERLSQNTGGNPYTFFIPFRTDVHDGDLFLYQQLQSNGLQNKYTSVTSPSVTALNGFEDYCLRFWTYMEAYHEEIFEVKLQLQPGKQEILLEQFTGYPSPAWELQSIDFATKSNFLIMLKVEIPPDSRLLGFLAVDEVVLRRGLCSIDAPLSAETVCDFEEGSCGYESSGDSETVKWIRTSRLAMPSGDLLLLDLTPSEDNTDHSEEGHFAFAYLGPATDAIPSGAVYPLRAYFTSPEYDIRGAHCVSFYYRNLKLSDKIGPDLALRTFLSAVDTDLWSSSVAHGKKWIAIKKTVNHGSSERLHSLKLQFIVTAAKGSKGSVALDDIAISPGDCQHPGDCSFNIGSTRFCSWTRLISDETNMQWTNAKPAGGPPSESGYIYIEGGRNTGYTARSKAVLYSEDIDYEETGLCMTFSYYSNSYGAAVVRIHQVEDPKEYNPLWEHYGRSEQANVTFGSATSVWKLAKIPIPKPKSGSDFLITIEAVILRETTYVYYVAIDDVQFLNQPCILSPPDSLPIPTVAPPTEDTAEVCTFDDDIINNPLCGFNNNTVSPQGPSIPWKLVRFQDYYQSISVDESLPAFDHSTLQDIGNYMYFNSTGQTKGSYGRIISPSYSRIKPTDPRCVRFWYKAGGERPGHLRVFARNGTDYELWHSGGWTTRSWSLVTFPAPESVLSFQLMFEGDVTLDDAQGGFALDDIAVAPWECRQMDCDFSHGLCNWENYYDDYGLDELDWEYATSQLLPSRNDSVNRGFFVYTPIRSTTKPGSAALLRHTGLVPGAPNMDYCLTFDFLVSTRNVGYFQLLLYWINDATNQYDYGYIWKLGDRVPNIGDWQTGQIFINRKMWTLMIETVANPRNETLPDGLHGIALDNIRHETVPDEAHCPTLPEEAAMPTLPPTTPPPVVLFNCSFDTDWCGFTSIPGSDPPWVRTNQGNNEPEYVWRVPYRTDNHEGDWFFYQELYTANRYSYASVASPLEEALTGNPDYCLRFWLLMEAYNEERFKVVLQEQPSKRETLLEQFVGESIYWTQESIDFKSISNFQILLDSEIPPRSEMLGHLAVDEMVLTRGKCSAGPSMEFCNFEEDICGYGYSGDAETVMWIRTSRLEMPGGDFGLLEMTPSEDNTYHSEEGHYAFAYVGPATDQIQSGVKEARFTSPGYAVKGTHCASFFYRNLKLPNKPSPTFSFRTILNHLDGPQTHIWNSTIAHGKKWVATKKTLELDPVVTLTLQFQFSVGAEKGARGGIAIDDVAISPGPCQHAGDCTFNSGSTRFCGWQKLISDETNMVWNNGMPIGGPASQSGYIFIEGGRHTGHGPRSRAVLYSEDISFEPGREAMCMTFMYFFNSSGAAVVRVHQVAEPKDYNPLWEHYGRSEAANTTFGTDSSIWKMAKIPIPAPWANQDFLITIEAVILREVNVRYFMAIEDVQFLAQPCILSPDDSLPLPTVAPPTEETVNVCTFDDYLPNTPLCGWENITAPGEDTIPWKLYSGEDQPIDLELPPFDHTTLEDFGNFLYFNSTGQRAGSYGRVITPAFTRVKETDPRCVRFWYFARGIQPGYLRVNAMFDGQQPELWNSGGWTTGAWNLANIPAPEKALSFKLFFEGDVMSDEAHGGFGLDDIAVAPWACRQMDCDFEHGLCNWENYYDSYGLDEFDWEYATSKLLPSKDDSAVNRGFFLYAPIRNTTKPRNAAFLRHTGLVPGGNATSGYCLTFEFMTTTRDVGQLTFWLYWVNQLSQYDYQVVWQLNENNPKVGEWQTGQIYVSRTEPWLFMIEALANPRNRTLPDGLHGIALDNIRHEIIPDVGHCPTMPEEAALPTPPPPPSTVNPALSFDCGFDEGTFCGWAQRGQDSYQWKIGSGSVGGAFAGPNGDALAPHTRTGKYVYIDAPGGNMGDEARLFSPLIRMTAPYCVRFRYNMNGKGMGNVDLYYMENSEQFGAQGPLYTVYGGNYGDQWIGASYTIDSNAYSEEIIVLEATRGSFVTAFIALDEISLNRGSCESEGSCDFGSGWCNYNPTSGLTLTRWRLGENPVLAYVTKGTEFDKSIPLRSEVFSYKPKKACYRFKYLLRGYGFSLNIKTIQFPADDGKAPIETLLWSQLQTAQASSEEFLDARIPISSPNKFQISIEVVFFAEGPQNSTVFIDDVVMASAEASCEYLPESANPSFVPGSTTTNKPGFSEATIIPTMAPTIATPLSNFSCNFDNNHTCGWTGPQNSQWPYLHYIPWKLSNRPLHSASGPDTDHSGYGYFAYFDTLSGGPARIGELTSPSIKYVPLTTGGEIPPYYVLSFWYHMHGAGIESLAVHTKIDYPSFPLYVQEWILRGDQGRYWKQAQIVMPLSVDPFKVTFEGTRKAGSQVGLISIDNIVFHDDKIPDQFDSHICDFDTPSKCGYDQHSDSGYEWTWRNGVNTSQLNDTGPSVDKSQNTNMGYYMAFDVKDRAVGGKVKLQSTVQGESDAACIKFYYYKKSNQHKGTLQVSIARNAQSTGVLWTDDNMIGGDFWEPVFINIQSHNQPWRVIWEAIVADVNQPIVAIDHVILTDGLCQPNLLYCNFDEESFCEWSNDMKNDQVNWMLTYGPSQVPGTGPYTDQGGSLQGGYALFDAAEAGVPEAAALVSTPIRNDGRPFVCLTFWYHMYGAEVGELTVFQKLLLPDEMNAVWLLRHDQYNMWRKARVPLSADGNTPYQVVLEATRLDSSGIRGNIAIDSIDEDLTATTCSFLPGDAQVISQPTTTTELSTSPAPKSMNCTFESDTCAWVINETEVQWRRKVAFASFSLQAPTSDHTLQTGMGHYMILEGFAGSLNQSAQFRGPLIDGANCMKFYYHAAGLHVGTLNVIQRFEVEIDWLSWSRDSPDEGRVWQFAEIDFGQRFARGYSIMFEAVLGDGHGGNFAVDDIIVTEGQCHAHGRESVCDFEYSLCGFTPFDPNAMTFIFTSPSTAQNYPFYAPFQDVSLGNRNGHFLMATMSSTSNATQAQIRTPDYTPTNMSSPVCFKFFYNFFGTRNTNDSFMVTVHQVGVTTTIHEIRGNQGHAWLMATATLPIGAPFYVVFTVNFHSGVDGASSSVVSIDDVSVSNETCTHPLNCEFDTDSLCLWNNLHKDDAYDHIDWFSVSPAFTHAISPTVDAPGSDKGWFAFVTAEIPSQSSDQAWLVSPQIAPDVYVCLTFWYNMGGSVDSMSLLRLKGVDFADNYTNTYWRVETGQTGIWLKGQVGHTAPWRHNLVFEAIVGNNRQGYIALDSLKVADSNCEIFPAEASPSYTPPTTTTPVPGVSGFECNFENGENDWCHFKNAEETDGFCKWVLRKGHAVLLNTGPSSDHTYQTQEGTYLYYQSIPCYDDPTSLGAELTTINALGDFRETSQCFSFWYFMYGAPNALIIAKNATSGDLRMEFMKKGNQGKQWKQALVTIDNPDMGAYNIIIGAPKGPSMFADIALDDFVFSDGPCSSTQGLCDFESGHLCGLSSVTVAGGAPNAPKYKWDLGVVNTLDNFPTVEEPIVYDHTFSTTEGHIAFADGKNFPKSSVAYLVSPPQSRSDDDQCLTFWYQLPSRPNGGRLQVHIFRAALQNQFGDPVWSVGGGFRNAWEYGTVPVRLLDDFKYAFEAINGINAFIALDDVMLTNRSCPKPLTCDFEDGMCGWTNSVGDHFDWILFQGESSTGDSAGPTVDHTLGNPDGHYVYVDNEYPDPMVYDSAHLTSERIHAKEGSRWCFQFWYHMYIDSQSNASLELLLREFDDLTTSIWLQNQPNRNMWLQTQVNLVLVSDFRLTFVGTVHGAHGKSDIALDDFSMDYNACYEKPEDPGLKCPTGLIIPRTKVCDQRSDCPGGEDELNCGTCSFESSLCLYTIFDNDEFSWELRRGANASFVGALGSSSYMYADVAAGASRTSSYLDSPIIRETSATCKLTFYYRFDAAIGISTDLGAILVSMRMLNTDTVVAIVDANLRGLGVWSPYQADIGRYSGEFHLVLRARKGYVQQGSLAVDAIVMENCGFPRAIDGLCPAGVKMWKCPESRGCIMEDQVCDFTDDCGARDDEPSTCAITNPIRCDFDVDFCDWSHDPTADFRWIQTTRRTEAGYTGPLRDHTTGLKNGGFIHIRSSASGAGKKARLISPIFNATSPSDPCVLRFYAHMYGKDTGTLQVFVVPAIGGGPSVNTFTEMGSSGDTWLWKRSEISSTVPYRVALQATTIGGNSGDISLDDISFSASCTAGSPTTSTSASTVSSSTTTVVPLTSSSTTTPTTVSTTISSTSTASTSTSSRSSSAATTNPNTDATTSAATSSTVSSTNVPCPGLWCAPSQTCLNDSVICDGNKDCEDGFDEDERECVSIGTVPTDDVGLGGGEIAGIVIGVLGAVGLGGAGLFVLWKRKQGQGFGRRSNTNTSYTTFGPLDGGKDSTDNAGLDDLYSGDL